jgi:hypothetical protein
LTDRREPGVRPSGQPYFRSSVWRFMIQEASARADVCTCGWEVIQRGSLALLNPEQHERDADIHES